jgi:tRNA-2-methylthio-N6-dimethylallyladenosine synthase
MSCYYIWSVGCQMNKAFADRLADDLGRMGYTSAAIADDADVIVINTCVVRQSAESRVVSKLDSLFRLKRLRPDTLIAVTGCLVDPAGTDLSRRFPHVDLFLKAGDSAELLELARLRIPAGARAVEAGACPPTAYVTAMEGCDNFCTYCIVPYRRGRERSRSPADVCAEVEQLVTRGAREVTLLGQNVDSYGHDLSGRIDLADLLDAVNSIGGLARIRFLTSHPKDMGDRLISAVASLPKVCECISLPVQAGDDCILVAMGRGYTVRDYRDRVRAIRMAAPGVAISTDVIVGFPGETEEQFQGTLDLLSELRFDKVHVACYSPRPGTLASRTLKDDVPTEEKHRRLRAVESLEEEIAAGINTRLLGVTLEILVEGRRKGKWWGRTRTGKLVFFDDEADLVGQLVDVEISKTSAWSLQGKLKKRP